MLSDLTTKEDIQRKKQGFEERRRAGVRGGGRRSLRECGGMWGAGGEW